MGFFSLGKESRPAQQETVAMAHAAVTRFLEQRQVENFKVYVVLFDHQPIVLIKAQPQKRLRFSNIIELQIRKFVREQTGIEIPAVFWRFKTGYDEDPGQEQADYDEQAAYPEQQTASPDEPETTSEAVTETQAEPALLDDVRFLGSNAIAVEEISLDHFEQFLSDRPPTSKPAEKPEIG